MQALRLARSRAPLSTRLRCLATTANPSHGNASTSAPSTPIIPLSNVEAQWEKFSTEEQVAVHQQLEQLQKKDWKELSLDEKKAAYYVAFGPHGPRTPVNPPGSGYKIFFGVICALGVSSLLFVTSRSQAAPPPKTLTKEWQEAANERAKEQKMNPITGISSEGYSGKGFVTSK